MTITPTPVVTGNNTQILDVAFTLAAIVVNPTNVVWYTSLANANAGANPLVNSTVVTNTTYYGVNTTNGCPSNPFAVTVTTANLSSESFNFKDFIFYPNPTNGIVYIKNNNQINQVKVYNLLGQLVIDNIENKTDIEINLSDLPSQLYTIKVLSNGFQKTFKILKNLK